MILDRILGSSKVIETGLKLIDDLHYSDGEEAEDKRKIIAAKTDAKAKLLDAYAPFKTTQRYIALIFTAVFVFILINGVLSALYGIVPMSNVDSAREFGDKMWLGEIMMTIVGWYFGGGVIESWKRQK